MLPASAGGNPQIAQISQMLKSPNVNRDPQTYATIGAAMEVHRHLGCGFLEAVYQQSLAVELRQRQIPFKREVGLQVLYKGNLLGCSYRADFVCYDSVIVELKATSQLTGADDAQLINELKASGMNRGLLINFGAQSLDYKRLVLNLRQSVQSADQAFLKDQSLN